MIGTCISHPRFVRALGLPILFIAAGACSPSASEPQESESEPIATVQQPAVIPSGFSDERIISGIRSPTAMAFAPDGRLFVSERAGTLRVIKNGVLLPTPFATVPAVVGGERGLLGITFDPNFVRNQYVYVYYTAPTPVVHNRLSRFTANGDVAVPGSEVALLDLQPLGAQIHNGGALHFGPTGKLYISVGENADGPSAQWPRNTFGKMLRINSDGTIPTDNPYYADSNYEGINKAIWAMGLRNPFTFAIQPGTGMMYINDVGGDKWEEINEGLPRANFGWPATEGPHNDPRYAKPVFAYPHPDDGATTQPDIRGCAITAGTFYNPDVVNFPGHYVDRYFFAEYCRNFIGVYNPTLKSASIFATDVSSVIDLDVGPDGALYYASYYGGHIGRIRYTGAQAPQVTSHPANATVGVGQSATFSIGVSGSQPITFQWQRNGSNITGATASTYTIGNVTAADNAARFRAVVRNSVGTATSNDAVLTVSTSAAPVVNITAPAVGARYRAGAMLSYAGGATDAEDGTLPASRLTWRIDFHHDTHFHPFMPDTSGVTSGSIRIPDVGEVATNVWYRVHLTVRDSAGLTSTSYRDVSPVLSTLRLRTNPSGLLVKLDGAPVRTPVDVQSVVGLQRLLGVDSPQTLNGDEYFVMNWSDDGKAEHWIRTPEAATTYTATFTPGCQLSAAGSRPTSALAVAFAAALGFAARRRAARKAG